MRSSQPTIGQGLEFLKVLQNVFISVIRDKKYDSRTLQSVIVNPQALYQLAEQVFEKTTDKEKKDLNRQPGNKEIRTKQNQTQKETPIFSPIFGTVVMEALNGKISMSIMKKIFKGGMEMSLQNYIQSKPNRATVETLLEVRELIENATLAKIFTKISCDLNKIAMSMAQIVCFCEKHSNFLREEGYATFFLTRIGNEFFVIFVCQENRGLSAGMKRIDFLPQCFAESKHRVVTPRIESVNFSKQ